MNRLWTYTFLSACLYLLVSGGAYAAPITYTGFADFQANLPGKATTLDFDDLTAGKTIGSGDTVGGITFRYDFGGVVMEVRNDFETTSPPNYLGTDDGGVFQDGDDFELLFAPSNAIGLFFTTADQMFDKDITLTAGGVSVGLATVDVEFLPLGDQQFFLGVIDHTATFTTARIATIGGGFFFYNVDDITRAVAPQVVPEPGGMALAGLGIALLLARRRTDR